MKAWASLAAAGMLVVAITAVSADAQPVAPNRYKHYAACGLARDLPASHSCPKRGKKGAFFKSLDAHVMYKVCVKFPDGRRLCAGRQDAPRGELKINSIRSHMVGRHVVTWYVAGQQVGTFAFRIHA
jgi:hypothetical protein